MEMSALQPRLCQTESCPFEPSQGCWQVSGLRESHRTIGVQGQAEARRPEWVKSRLANMVGRWNGVLRSRGFLAGFEWQNVNCDAPLSDQINPSTAASIRTSNNEAQSAHRSKRRRPQVTGNIQANNTNLPAEPAAPGRKAIHAGVDQRTPGTGRGATVGARQQQRRPTPRRVVATGLHLVPLGNRRPEAHMRYSLAGGYQSNGENGSGSDYCIKWSDGYRSLDPTEVEIREAMEQWMGSPGHRSNILDRWYKKVNVGLAWDRYNFKAFQHFEGDYIEFDSLPAIEDGILTLTGRARNGARFADERDLMVQVYYDPPPHPLTRGQVARTYCYDLGLPVAGLREPATGGWYYSEQAFSTTHQPCPDPYDVDPEASAPESADEADRFWQQAYAASHSTVETITVPWITALVWTADGDRFSVTADLRKVIGQHGDGVYTVLLWDRMNGEDAVISQYSMFHGVTAPETYSGDGN